MIFLFQAPIDWSAIGKTWGPLGIIFIAAIILLFAALRFLRTYLTKKDEEAAKLILDTITDARKERDASRQLLKEQAAEFVAHIKSENEEFRLSLRDVVGGFERGRKR